MKSGDLLVYTCITGGYDELVPVAHPEPGVRYVCLSDHDLDETRGWQVRRLPADWTDPVLANRRAKMLPHLIFPEHARSVYVDGNILPKPGVRQLADDALREHDFAAFAHPFRDCAYDEGTECAGVGHAWVWTFARQLGRYRAEGFPAHAGLYECNVLLRNHHAPAVVRLMEAWWDEFSRGVRRDQLSLPYAIWKQAFPMCAMGPSDVRKANPHFTIQRTHKSSTFRRDLRGRFNRMLLPRLWLGT